MGSVTAQARPRQGDVVVAVDGAGITSYEDLLAALSQHKPGDTVTVTAITPGGQKHTYRVKLGALNVNSNG